MHVTEPLQLCRTLAYTSTVYYSPADTTYLRSRLSLPLALTMLGSKVVETGVPPARWGSVWYMGTVLLIISFISTLICDVYDIYI